MRKHIAMYHRKDGTKVSEHDKNVHKMPERTKYKKPKSQAYKIYDNELNQYAFQEFVFKDKESAIQQLLSFFEADHDEEEMKELEEIIRQENGYAGLVLEETEEKFKPYI